MAQEPEAQMIGLLRMSASRFWAGWLRGRVAQWMAVALGWLLLCGGILLLRHDASSLRDIPSNDPRDLILAGLVNLLAIVFVPLMLMLFNLASLPRNAPWLASQTMRAAAFADEGGQIPHASEQPEPLPADQTPRDMKPFVALKTWNLPTGCLSLLVAFFFLILIALAALAIVDPERDAMRQLSNLIVFVGPLFLFAGVFTRALGAPVITDGWSSLLPSRGARLLAVDDLGIRWRARGWRTRECTLTWQDIRAFCVFHAKWGSDAKVAYVYLLLGDDLSFVWTTSSRARMAVRSASDLLSRLVVTRTDKPLLDVTKAVETLDTWVDGPQEQSRLAEQQLQQVETSAQPLESQESKDRRNQPFQASGYLRDLLDASAERHARAEAELREMAALHQATIQESGRAGYPVRPLRLGARFYGVDIALMVALATSMVGMWGVNQIQLADYYRTLPARIAATAPLYKDAMTGAGGWFVQPPTPDDPSSYGYQGGGYAITGGHPGHINYVTMGGTYADVVVAVTVRQVGTADANGVGLVARDADTGADYDDQVIFYVDPLRGEWNLYHYQPGHSNIDDNWRYLDGGYDAGIHQGENVANRLMLVLRGNEYLCYINGQFVARVLDSTLTPSSPKSGYVGVYINDAVTGIFDNFALYPAPQPYQPLLGRL